MNAAIKKSVYKALASTGIHRALHGVLNKGQLSILMYHGVVQEPLDFEDWIMLDAAAFSGQMDYLQKHFRVVSMSKAFEMLCQGEISEPTAVITFDDGYQNNFEVAYPILQKRNLPASIYLATNLINTNASLKLGELTEAFVKTRESSLEWRDSIYNLTAKTDRIESLQTIKAMLKREHIDTVFQEVGNICSLLLGESSVNVTKDSPYRMLDTQSIREMADSGLIEFGAHTLNHAILSNLDRSEQQKEINDSVEAVSALSQRSCDFFAYPNGTPQDYNQDTLDVVQASEVKAALTTIEGTCNPKTHTSELRRFGVGADMDLVTFELMVHNFIGGIKALIRS